MYTGQLGENHLFVRLEKGENIVESLQQIAQAHSITNAGISGIGSIENPILAHYTVTTKKYLEKPFTGIYEVISLLGNIAYVDQKPLVHAHCTISDEEMHAFAGHLVSGIVSATMELILTIFPTTYGKKMNEEIGLKLLDLPDTE